jgi:hypothetical protein
VPNSDFVLLTGGVHQAWGPHVSDRTSGALQGWHVRGSVSAIRVHDRIFSKFTRLESC